MRRRPPLSKPDLLLVLAGVTVAVTLGASPAARPPGALAQDRPQRVIDRDLPGADPHARVPAPDPRLVAHEWGVWLLKHGRVAHLQDLAAESPDFVLRAPGVPLRPSRPPHVQRPDAAPPAPVPPPRPPAFPGAGNDMVARKPVIFLRASRPVEVTVEVGFLGGEPWLFYPDARILDHGPTPGSRSILFHGRVGPGAGAPLAATLPGQWWNDLRRAGGQVFVSEAGHAERFLFYDGPVTLERPFLVAWQGRGAQVTPTGTERTIFLVDRGRFDETEVVAGAGARPIAEGDMAALRERLRGHLTRRGLTAAEARALLDTWRDALLVSPTTRAIYFLSREAYDRVLPIRITPAPAELVRVGLVIEDLSAGP